jgi:hypothetical protein
LQFGCNNSQLFNYRNNVAIKFKKNFPLLIGAITAIPRYAVVGDQGLISFRQFRPHHIGQAFHLFAILASEMDMLMGMMVLSAVLAQGKVKFTFIGYELVDKAVFAETIQHPIDRHPVHFPLDALFQYILA